MNSDKDIRASLPLPAQIASLQIEYDELSNLRDHTVDVKEFDQICKQMVEVHKRITLLTNRIRLAAEAAEAEKRSQALALLEKHQAKIAELKTELTKRDEILFSALEIFYKQVNKELEFMVELQELTMITAKEAQDLETTPVPLAGMSRLGANWQAKPEKICDDLVRVFSDQFWSASDARKNGTPVREDFPNVESLSTVGRITDWGPWLVKSGIEPPPEPADTDVDPSPVPE